MLLTQILKTRDQPGEQVQLRKKSSEAVADLERSTTPQNARLIEAMANKLLKSLQPPDGEDGNSISKAHVASNSAP
jgi:hypothetical protein